MALFGKKKDKKQDVEEIEITEISVEGKEEKVEIKDATEEELNYAIGESMTILKNNRDVYKKAKEGTKMAITWMCVGVGLFALNYATGNQATIMAAGGIGLAGLGVVKAISAKKKKEKIEKSNLEAKAIEKASHAELEAREKAKEEKAKAEAETKREDLVLVEREREKEEDKVDQIDPEETEAEA